MIMKKKKKKMLSQEFNSSFLECTIRFYINKFVYKSFALSLFTVNIYPAIIIGFLRDSNVILAITILNNN